VPSPLQSLSGPGQPLRKEARDATEFTNLKKSALNRLADAQKKVWRVLAHAHDLRNRGEYEGDLHVDERLLADLIAACKVVASALEKLPAL
jgi:hypothetical protein